MAERNGCGVSRRMLELTCARSNFAVTTPTTPVHISAKRMNNRAESSHVPVRRRDWKLQGFKSPGSAQRFLSMHAATYNTFAIPRHLTSARTHRLFRAEAFSVSREAAGVAA